LVPIASNRVKAPIAIIALLVAIGVAAWALTMPPTLPCVRQFWSR